MHAIEAQGLTKRYRDHEALQGLDLAVPQGSAFGLIGANGAGKTTCVKILLDVVRPTEGEVRVLGGHPSDVSVRRRLGYLPERLQLPGGWTALAFLRSVARLKGLPPSRECEVLLERLGLSGDANRKLRTFSKGMGQKVGLAAALLGSPSLLILDEPTDGIDPMGRILVRDVLAEERRRGATIFLNSHLLSETERICDRIGILAGGKMVRQGPRADLQRGSGRWKVRIEPLQDPSRLGLLPAQDPWVFWIDAADAHGLNRELDRIRKEGALVLELVQEVRSLEEVLAESVEAA